MTDNYVEESVLFTATVREIVVEFEYTTCEGEHETRVLAPYEMYEAKTVSGAVYVRGWDFARQAIRQFAIDRVRYARMTNRAWRPPITRESS